MESKTRFIRPTLLLVRPNSGRTLAIKPLFKVWLLSALLAVVFVGCTDSGDSADVDAVGTAINEEIEYLDTKTAIDESMADKVDELGDHLATFTGTDSWYTEADVLTTEIQALAIRFQVLESPSERFDRFHATASESYSTMFEAMSVLEEGIDEFDPDKTRQAASLMEEASNLTDLSTELLPDIE